LIVKEYEESQTFGGSTIRTEDLMQNECIKNIVAMWKVPDAPDSDEEE